MRESYQVVNMELGATIGDDNERIRLNQTGPMGRNPEFASIPIVREHPPLRLKTAMEDQLEFLPEPRVKGMSYAKDLINAAIIVCAATSTL